MPQHEGMNAGILTETSDGGEGSGPKGPLDDIRSGIKAFIDVGITLGTKLDEHTAAMREYFNRLERFTPVDYTCQASGNVPASGNLVLNLGSPDLGTYWEVQSVAVGGLDQNVTAAGTAGLYVSGMVPSSGAVAGFNQSPGMISMRDQALTMPNVAFYGSRDLLVKPEEYLFLIIFGGTVAQQYAANARVAVIDVRAAGGRAEITI